jgi:hypothetical protein
VNLDTANRSFFALVGVALVPYLLLGVVGCGLFSVVAYRIATDGLGAVTGDAALWPALAFFAVITAGTVLTARSVRRQLRATHRLAGSVRSRLLAHPDALVGAARTVALDGTVDLVDDPAPYSFSYGVVRPRVAVSRGLVERASEPELGAVLAHEAYHVRNLDPAKVVAARALSAAYFFLPALRHLRHLYLTGRELAADRRAVRDCGRAALAGALHKVVAGPDVPALAGAAALGGTEFLDARLSQLESGEEPPLDAVPSWATAATGAGLLALGAALTVTVIALGGPARLMGDGMMARSGGGGVDGLEVVGGVLCGGLWAAGGWVAWRRLGRRGG